MNFSLLFSDRSELDQPMLEPVKFDSVEYVEVLFEWMMYVFVVVEVAAVVVVVVLAAVFVVLLDDE